MESIAPVDPRTANDALLELRTIKKAFFGVRVLNGVSLRVRRGTVLGLVGENGAGKSTLMNILGGNLQPDTGELLLDGTPYEPGNPTDAARAGIAFVHQELNLFPNLSIAENLFLTAFPRRGAFIARGALRRQTAALLGEVGLAVSPDTPVERLSAGERQLVEVARALALDRHDPSRDSRTPGLRLMILDEPTTSLSARETENLFALLSRLRQRGVAMIYISHILGDVLRLCDDIVVLRDGEVAGQGPRAEFTAGRMISLMVGRELTQLYPQRKRAASVEAETPPASARADDRATVTPPQTALLELRGVSQPHVVRDVSLTLHAGEVLGISGLMGAGRSELARIIFGLDRCSSGTISLNGQLLPRTGPRGRIRRSAAFVTEDRRLDGLCLDASIADNMALVGLRRHGRSPLRIIQKRHWREAIHSLRERVQLNHAARDEQPVRTLSGGNQQKVVLGKWLMAEPRVFILDEPTRGIDVGARFEVYQLIHQLAEQGAGVLVISSEMEELIGICDRILVMSQGEIRDELRAGEFDRERMLRSAMMEGERAAFTQAST
jgi:ribose transport system ATP-binding protein